MTMPVWLPVSVAVLGAFAAGAYALQWRWWLTAIWMIIAILQTYTAVLGVRFNRLQQERGRETPRIERVRPWDR